VVNRCTHAIPSAAGSISTRRSVSERIARTVMDSGWSRSRSTRARCVRRAAFDRSATGRTCSTNTARAATGTSRSWSTMTCACRAEIRPASSDASTVGVSFTRVSAVPVAICTVRSDRCAAIASVAHIDLRTSARRSFAFRSCTTSTSAVASANAADRASNRASWASSAARSRWIRTNSSENSSTRSANTSIGGCGSGVSVMTPVHHGPLTFLIPDAHPCTPPFSEPVERPHFDKLNDRDGRDHRSPSLSKGRISTGSMSGAARSRRGESRSSPRVSA